MASLENKFIVWIDGEYTGLRDEDTILEIACIITDNNLNVVSEDFNVVINQPDAVLENMSEWCIDHHAKSGLVDDCKSSKISIKEAEHMLLNFLKKYVQEGTCPMAESLMLAQLNNLSVCGIQRFLKMHPKKYYVIELCQI
ncbi:putative oligoribonuclease isoform X2 [Colletes latitarsis]|uniref:putative oligoribonuclease isoform X2 n=1 Tax=Colletes latitarsis TaxID=2605962 RepID=UPI004036CCD2